MSRLPSHDTQHAFPTEWGVQTVGFIIAQDGWRGTGLIRRLSLSQSPFPIGPHHIRPGQASQGSSRGQAGGRGRGR